MQESIGEIVGGSNGGVRGGSSGHGDFGREPNKCIGNAFSHGLNNPDAEASVMMESWAKVPAIDGVRCPCFASGRLIVDEDPGARRS